MQAATLEAFIKPFKRRYEYGVAIPFVGLVTIGNVSEGQRQAIIKWSDKKGNEDKSRARWFVETVYRFDPNHPEDANPSKLFAMEHIDALAEMDSAISAALMLAINKHCWPDEPDVRSAEKNSDATQTGDSPSS